MAGNDTKQATKFEDGLNNKDLFWESIDTVSLAEETAAQTLLRKGSRSKTEKQKKSHHKQGRRRKGKNSRKQEENNDKQRREMKKKKRSIGIRNARLFKKRFDLLNCDNGNYFDDEISCIRLCALCANELCKSTKFDVVLNNRELLSCEILSYLDVVSLVQTKAVSTLWRDCCDAAIGAKGGKPKRAFTDTDDELHYTVTRYVRGDRDEIEYIAREFGYPIGKWDVSLVMDFSFLFCAYETFNEDISEWKTSNATTMKCMFYEASNFNGDLSSWDTSNVTNMEGMFGEAVDFNGDLSRWNTSNVTNMQDMFREASNFNSDLSRWDVSNVTNMGVMFWGASKFNGDLSNWDVAPACARYAYMFYGTKVNPNLFSWYNNW